MSVLLFRVATERVNVSWSTRGDVPHEVLGTVAFRPCRHNLTFSDCFRKHIPELSSRDPHQKTGPALKEQTDYQIFIEGLEGRRVRLDHEIRLQLAT